MHPHWSHDSTKTNAALQQEKQNDDERGTEITRGRKKKNDVPSAVELEDLANCGR